MAPPSVSAAIRTGVVDNIQPGTQAVVQLHPAQQATSKYQSSQTSPDPKPRWTCCFSLRILAAAVRSRTPARSDYHIDPSGRGEGTKRYITLGRYPQLSPVCAKVRSPLLSYAIAVFRPSCLGFPSILAGEAEPSTWLSVPWVVLISCEWLYPHTRPRSVW